MKLFDVRCFRHVVAVLGLYSYGTSCWATPPLIWPDLVGSGGCSHTLQECIDFAASGDTILISVDETVSPDAYTAINESITITKSLSLLAAEGIDAVFTSGHSITVNSPSTGSTAVTLSRLTLFHGHVIINHLSDSDSFYTLDQMYFNETDAGSGESVVYFQGGGIGTPAYTVSNSRLDVRQHSTGFPPDGVRAYRFGGSWYINFLRNQIRVENGALGYGLASLGGSGDLTGTVTVDGNQLLGHQFTNGILVSAGGGSSGNTIYLHNNMVAGQGGFVGSYGM